jgi:hypothetical protein
MTTTSQTRSRGKTIDSRSPWAAPDFSKALAQVERLLPAYRGRAVLTRYVPPNALTGA